MCRRLISSTVIGGITLFLVSTGWADIPAPPVNQDIGMPDIAISSLAEADCRVCHGSGIPDRHHLLYGQTISAGSLVPYPDADGDGNPDTVYACLNCHDDNFTVARDCLACHTGDSPHHTTPAATSRDCSNCHGSLVDNFDDSHYIPTYSTSLVTPSPSGGAAGACDYCHDGDGLATPVLLTNQELHHSASLNCDWCHQMHGTARIRVCESCHGPDTLHNIQADSPNPSNVGTIVVGGEDAGYGHVGRDAGPGDSDCWGCHGFAGQSLTAISGPIAPTVYNARPDVIKAGTDTLVVLTGSAFTNTTGETLFESDALLTTADGSSVTLKPGIIIEGLMKVTIPGTTASGNYILRAVKTHGENNPVVSNAVSITIVRAVIIANVTVPSDGIVTIEGNGFGGYAAGSGTSVTGNITTGDMTTTVEATIVSWSDTIIKADFGASPQEVTVNSVFGTDTSEIGGKPAGPTPR